GTPIIALQGVTGLDLRGLSAMVGRQLPFFSVLVPFWVVAAFAGLRGMWAVWPAAFVAGLSFAVPQFLLANYHGPWLVDVVSAMVSMAALAALLRVWQPRDSWRLPGAGEGPATEEPPPAPDAVGAAWRPWLLLSVFVFVWGLPAAKSFLNGLSAPRLAVPY